jgi:hypothetical protein
MSILSRGRRGVDASSCGGWIFVSFPGRHVVVFWSCVAVSWWCRRHCVAAFMHRRVVSLSRGGGGVVVVVLWWLRCGVISS